MGGSRGRPAPAVAAALGAIGPGSTGTLPRFETVSHLLRTSARGDACAAPCAPRLVVPTAKSPPPSPTGRARVNTPRGPGPCCCAAAARLTRPRGPGRDGVGGSC